MLINSLHFDEFWELCDQFLVYTSVCIVSKKQAAILKCVQFITTYNVRDFLQWYQCSQRTNFLLRQVLFMMLFMIIASHLTRPTFIQPNSAQLVGPAHFDHHLKTTWLTVRFLGFGKIVLVHIEDLFEVSAGLISKAVKTYFDRKAVKTRLKLVKTGLNRSKPGQNLKLRNTYMYVPRVVKEPCYVDLYLPLCVWLVYLECWKLTVK